MQIISLVSMTWKGCNVCYKLVILKYILSTSFTFTYMQLKVIVFELFKQNAPDFYELKLLSMKTTTWINCKNPLIPVLITKSSMTTVAVSVGQQIKSRQRVQNFP